MKFELSGKRFFMGHSHIRFLSAGILILKHGSVPSIITGQIPAGNTDVTKIQKYSLNGCRLCEEMPLNVYGTKETR